MGCREIVPHRHRAVGHIVLHGGKKARIGDLVYSGYDGASFPSCDKNANSLNQPTLPRVVGDWLARARYSVYP